MRLPADAAEVRVTGMYPLLNHLASGLMSDQLNTLLLATATVFSIMWTRFAAFGYRLPRFHQAPKRARTLSIASTFKSLVLFWSEEFQELSIAASHANGLADWAISAGGTVG